MGLVTKRRDNAPIVKYIYGRIIEIIMEDGDMQKAIQFLLDTLRDLEAKSLISNISSSRKH